MTNKIFLSVQCAKTNSHYRYVHRMELPQLNRQHRHELLIMVYSALKNSQINMRFNNKKRIFFSILISHIELIRNSLSMTKMHTIPTLNWTFIIYYPNTIRKMWTLLMDWERVGIIGIEDSWTITHLRNHGKAQTVLINFRMAEMARILQNTLNLSKYCCTFLAFNSSKLKLFFTQKQKSSGNIQKNCVEQGWRWPFWDISLEP